MPGQETQGRSVTTKTKNRPGLGQYLWFSLASLVTLPAAAIALAAWLQQIGVWRPVIAWPFRHPGWPTMLALLAGTVAVLAWPGPANAFVRKVRQLGQPVAEFWQRSGLVWRLVFCALAGHLLVSSPLLLEIPGALQSAFRENRQFVVGPVRTRNGQTLANWQYHLRTWQQLPPQAGIVYRGGWEAMLVAYHLYPRRLYLLPEDATSLAARWHDHRWLEKKTAGQSRQDRWTDEYWRSRLCPVAPLGDDFLRLRDVQAVIEFREESPADCRVIRLPPAEDVTVDKGDNG